MKKTILLKLMLSVGLIILLFGCAGTMQEAKPAADALSVITGIKLQDNGLEITGNKHFVYTMYTANDPYKISIDIPDMHQGDLANKIVSDKAGITEVVLSQSDSPSPSLRIDVMLQTPASVTPLYKDNTLLLVLKPEEPSAPAVSKAAAKESSESASASGKEIRESAAPDKSAADEGKQSGLSKAGETKAVEEIVAPMHAATQITSIDLKKTPDALKVIVKGNGSLNPNIFPLSDRIVVDIPRVQLKAAVPSVVVPPLKGIRAGRHRDKIRLVLDLREKTTFDVAATGDYIEVSLRKKDMVARNNSKAAPASKPMESATRDLSDEGSAAKNPSADDAAIKEITAKDAPQEQASAGETSKELQSPKVDYISGKKFRGKKISLDFQESEVAPIFRLMADVYGYNLVLDPSVRGRITLKLLNVPWDQALDIILNQTHYSHRIDGNILWIAPSSVFDALITERAKTKETVEKAEDLVQEIVRVNYATAGDMSAAISSGKLLSTRGSITIDNRMNTLIIKDTQRSIDNVKDLMKIMDVAKPQVMIEAKIVEVGNNYSNVLGISWGGSFSSQTWPNTFGTNFSVNTPTSSAGPGVTNPGGALSMNIGRANAVNVSLSLSALESIGKSKTLSNPKILTMDNEAATIQQGRTFFIETVSQAGTQTQQQSATLSLSVTPKITPDGFVQLKVTATDNSLESVTPPVVNTKSLNTQALVKNGETLVLGGIYTTDVTEGEKDVPFLSKIPGLGWLFKTKSQSGPNVKELLIFITPVIMPQQQ